MRDQVCAHLIQCLMGGGLAFASGGPGRGMHSYLYENVLGQFGWVQV